MDGLCSRGLGWSGFWTGSNLASVGWCLERKGAKNEWVEKRDVDWEK